MVGAKLADEPLAVGGRLVEHSEPDGDVAPDHHRPGVGLDDHDLEPGMLARRGDEAEPAQQLELAVDRHVGDAGASTHSRIV